MNSHKSLGGWRRTFAFAICLVVAPSLALPGQEANQPAASINEPPTLPPAVPDEPHVLPINLPAAMHLANVRALDIAAASERLQVAVAQLRQAQVLWLPTMAFGGDYFRHDGRIQDVVGNILTTSKSALMVGAGSGYGNGALISINDAIFAPLAARRVADARQAAVQAARNDALLDVTEAYLTVQQARGELAGAVEVTRLTRDLVELIGKLAAGLVPPVEAIRARAELTRRQQAELLARQRWRLASADLLRVLNLDPTTQVEPVEPPHLRIVMFDPKVPLESFLAIAQANRPELAAQQALLAAAQTQVRQERFRPLVPSLILRGGSISPGGLGVGVFGGGTNSTMANFGGRFDYDVVLQWQLDNLGLGNRARIRQRSAETRLAAVALNQLQNRVAAEVSRALAELRLAGERVDLAEAGLKLSQESFEKNLAGIRQPRRIGNTITLVNRPQEAVAAAQTLAQAYLDYYGAIADANRAQFRLYRALGQPAQDLICQTPPSAPASHPTLAFPPGPVESR